MEKKQGVFLSSPSRVLLVLSGVHKALQFEYLASHLPKDEFELSFILLNPEATELESYLGQNGIQVIRVPYSSRRQIPWRVGKVIRLIKGIQPQIVHTHLVDANLIGLTAAWTAGIKNRIHTRHHSDFHWAFHKHGLVYDFYSNRMSRKIVAVSPVVRDILIKKEKVDPNKIIEIPHAFDASEFDRVSIENISAIKKKYGYDQGGPVVGVISRYVHLKGHRYIISGFKSFLQKYPQAKLVLANAHGPDRQSIQSELKQLPANNYVEIKYDNAHHLFKSFDLFVHVPISPSVEAFGLVYLEALAAGVPSIFTKSGVANEFARHQENSWIVDYKNAEQIAQGLLELYENKELCKKMTAQGRVDVQNYSIKAMIGRYRDLYRSMLKEN